MRAKLAGMGEAAGAKNIQFNMAGCPEEENTPFQKLCRSRWAALIKKVYEVDPLKCPRCGGADEDHQLHREEGSGGRNRADTQALRSEEFGASSRKTL